VISTRRLRDDRDIRSPLCNRNRNNGARCPRSPVSGLPSRPPGTRSPGLRSPVSDQACCELLIRSRRISTEQSKLDPGRGIEPRSQLFDSKKEFVRLQREFSGVVSLSETIRKVAIQIRRALLDLNRLIDYKNRLRKIIERQEVSGRVSGIRYSQPGKGSPRSACAIRARRSRRNRSSSQ